MKKIISIVLLCTMLLTCFAGCGAKKGQIALNNDVEMQNLAVTIPADWKTGLEAWDGTSVTANWATQETLTIANGEDLKAFIDALKSGNDFSGKTITVTADINLGNQEWNPTVQASSQTFFKGTFDGDDHIIGNFKMTLDATDTDVTAHALLCSVGQGATVKDLKVVEGTISYTNTAADTTVAGGIVGEANTAGSNTDADRITLSNLYSAVTIKDSDASTKKLGIVGGILGKAKGGGYIVIENCISNSPITVKGNTVGGILGVINADVKGVTINDCEVLAAVSGGAQVGGILGGAATTSKTGVSYFVKLQDNVVKANVTAAGHNVGGIFGISDNTKRSITIDNCDIPAGYNVTVSGAGQQNGGVLGITPSSVTVVIRNCDINADLTFPYNGGQAGGILGTIQGSKLTIDNCHYNGTMTADRTAGGILGASNYGNMILINNCSVQGTLNFNITGTKNLVVGGIFALGRVGQGKSAVISNCTMGATMNVTMNNNGAAASYSYMAGGLIGCANDAPKADTDDNRANDPLWILYNNKVTGALNITDNDKSTVDPAYTDTIDYAGSLIGFTPAPGKEKVEVTVDGQKVEQEFDAYPPVFQFGGNSVTSAVTATDIEVPLLGGPNDYNYIEIIGHQTTEVTEGKYDLRFVAAADGDIEALGFIANIKYYDGEGKVIGDKLVTEYVKYAYTSIQGGGKTYTAAEYGADYLFTLTIKDIPEAYTPDNMGIQLHAIGADVVEGEGEAPDTINYLRGAFVTYGNFKYGESENEFLIEDSEEAPLASTLESVIGKATADITVDAGVDYKDNYFTGVQEPTSNVGYSCYPSTNNMYDNNGSALPKDANVLTYTIDVAEAGAYDIVFEIRNKNASARGVFMYINGEDGYYVHNAEYVNAGSYGDDDATNITVNSRFVKVVTYNLKEGENTISFRIDGSLGSALHLRKIHINKAA